MAVSAGRMGGGGLNIFFRGRNAHRVFVLEYLRNYVTSKITSELGFGMQKIVITSGISVDS